MRILLFGTYDTSMHPRVATIAEGLAASGLDVAECNAPLGLDTAARVDMLARPWTAPLLLLRLARRWTTLAVAARRMSRPDVVLVGYLGHFDVHLARLLFRRTPIVLDHLVGASDTGRDRRLDGGPRQALLRLIDAAALSAASIIVVDTDEHLAALPPRYRSRAVVVPVGAPATWTDAAPEAAAAPDGARPLKVVFYGLYTPLQGTPVIGAALGALAGAPIVNATQSGCISRTCSRVRVLSRPPERMTPTVRPVSTRTRMLSSRAARTSLAASSGSSIAGWSSPSRSRSTYGSRAGPVAASGPPAPAGLPWAQPPSAQP